MTKLAINRALISVYDKRGLPELARALADAGVAIVSTGSTAQRIAATGIPVTAVEELTGFPECLGGRVKTLHPGVHAGLLADLGEPEHRRQLDELGIAPFQLLVSNLYPFEAAVASGAEPGECVEQIDIGGPAMVRAAAKNHANVAVVTDPATYPAVIEAVTGGGFTLEERQRLAAQAYAHTARYDAAIASWFAGRYAPDQTARETSWPDVTAGLWERREVLRYGENPHQSAALYVSAGGRGAGLARAAQVHGKAMSYNNYVDAAAAWRAAHDFTAPCVVIVKHSNPCGLAVGADLAEAHRRAHACDPVSAYGGVIAANGVVTREMASQVASIFTEVVVAPGFDEAALEILTGRKNIRLITCPPPATAAVAAAGEAGTPAGLAGSLTEWRYLDGGLLIQTVDRLDAPGDDPGNWELRAGAAAAPDVLADLEFAWRASRCVKSNAIVLAREGATVGVGMGQVNRLDAARLAVARAGDRAAGAVAASDAFFPFPDGLQVLAEAGVRAVVEPGGSIRDEEVVAVARAARMTMYFTGTRHFFH